MARLKYFLSSLQKRLLRSALRCPSCGSSKAKILDRKWLVTSLQRCTDCRLLYRAPTTSEAENASYYQADYEQGFTTRLPTGMEVDELIMKGFSGHEKSYKTYIEVLSALVIAEGSRLYDYGCSWGYGSHQLKSTGLKVDAYEISEPRAAFARSKMGVNIVEPSFAPERSYDVFFSSHVVEHIPSVSRFIDAGRRLLKPSGIFVAFTPNGCAEFRNKNPAAWHTLWGESHPQLIDIEYLNHLGVGPILVATSPYPIAEMAAWTGEKSTVLDLHGDELMFAFKNRG